MKHTVLYMCVYLWLYFYDGIHLACRLNSYIRFLCGLDQSDAKGIAAVVQMLETIQKTLLNIVNVQLQNLLFDDIKDQRVLAP